MFFVLFVSLLRFRVLGTNPTGPHRPPPLRVIPVGTNTIINTDLQLIKTYFKLLQAIHHTEMLEKALLKGAPPLGTAKKVPY